MLLSSRSFSGSVIKMSIDGAAAAELFMFCGVAERELGFGGSLIVGLKVILLIECAFRM